MPHRPSEIFCDECGRSYASESALFAHQRRYCTSAKKGIREVLADARAYWKHKVLKRPRSIEQEGESSQPRLTGRHGASQSLPPEHTQNRLTGQRGPPEDLLERQGTERGRPRRSQFRPTSYRESPSPDTRVSVSPPISEDIQMESPNDIQMESPNDIQMESPNDIQMESPDGIHLQPSPSTPASLNHSPQDGEPCEQREWPTPTDQWGLSRVFYGRPPPAHNPDAIQPESDHTAENQVVDLSLSPVPEQASFSPYPNRSSFELGDWWWKQVSRKSISGFKDLVAIITHPDFDKAEILQANWSTINERLSRGTAGIESQLDNAAALPSEAEWVDDTGGDWLTTAIHLEIPFPKRNSHPNLVKYDVGTFHHRTILSVIKERLSNHDEQVHRHLRPFKVFWNPLGTTEGIRVYGELYTSDAFIQVDQEVQSRVLPNENDNTLERVVIALMVWTDATLLANFGTAKLWPCYLFFGNDSKYRRAKLSLNLCNHIAYFETLPDSFKDWYREQSGGKNPTKELLTHCTRELFHKQWEILLNDELLHAMQFGIKIQSADGISRLFFPRLFTYSADYPEKALIATIRYQGLCPCPRCLVGKAELDAAGRRPEVLTPRVDNDLRQDLVRSARQLIYEQSYVVGSKKVDELLKTGSLVPTENAFSKLTSFGFDVFSSLVVDLMHEFELGVWKALFIHLIRILEAHDRQSRSSSSLVGKLDKRYRLVPSFGDDTIRTFSSNASEQKRLGARDYENLLQCSYAAFDGLLPEPHNEIVTSLLLCCAEWHALAKLRMHTEETLALLDTQTGSLAAHMEKFISTTCSVYDTRETAKEQRARLRRGAKDVTSQQEEEPMQSSIQADTNSATQLGLAAGPSRLESVPLVPVPTTNAFGAQTAPQEGHDLNGSQSHPLPSNTDHPQDVNAAQAQPPPPIRKKVLSTTGRLRKKFNISTYKYHALGDFTASIRHFGTTDSYSTERGETEHKIPKSWYPRTDKKAFKKQMAKIDRRRANHRRIRQGVKPLKFARRYRRRVPLTEPYVLAASENAPKAVSSFYQADGNGDPALKDFMPKLQRHILPRIKRVLETRATADGLCSCTLPSNPSDWSFVVFKSHQLYSHQTIRIRYTTYDLRREEDLIRSHGPKSNIMVANPACFSDPRDEDAYPFRYGRVLGIFHANVIYVGPGNPDLAPQRLDFLWVRWYTAKGRTHEASGVDLLGFPNLEDCDAFGFLDPTEVCRGCHIIPRYLTGKNADVVGQSYWARDNEDYNAYFANRHADRDMFMRYHVGLGIGHQYSHKQRQRLLHPSLQPVARDEAQSPSSISKPDQNLSDKEGEDEEGQDDMDYRDSDEDSDVSDEGEIGEYGGALSSSEDLLE